MSEHGQVSWGKIIKGAAIAAGAVAVVAFFPETFSTIGDTVKGGISAVFGGLGSVGEWISTKVADIANYIVEHKALTIASAGVAGGLAVTAKEALSSGKHEDSMETESFAMKEDMRRMQALMMARMAATGYQPAIAANQPSRG